jgi:hypothetical protein
VAARRLPCPFRRPPLVVALDGPGDGGKRASFIAPMSQPTWGNVSAHFAVVDRLVQCEVDNRMEMVDGGRAEPAGQLGWIELA